MIRTWSLWGRWNLFPYGGCGTLALKPDSSTCSAGLRCSQRGLPGGGVFVLNVWNEHLSAWLTEQEERAHFLPSNPGCPPWRVWQQTPGLTRSWEPLLWVDGQVWGASWGAKLASLDEEAAGHASQGFGPPLSPLSWGLLFLLPGGWDPLRRALG